MTDAADFLATIRDAPQEAGPRLVFADWLEERGDPLAEFIRVQIALANNPSIHDVHELEATERRLLSKHAVRWAGPLGGRQPIAQPHIDGWDVYWPGRIAGRFRLGLLWEVSLSCASLIGDRCEWCRTCKLQNPHLSKDVFSECPSCAGSGRVNSLAADLAKHPLLPDSGVVLSDKRPAPSADYHGLVFWTDHETMPLNANYLPPEIINRLTGFEPISTSVFKYYPSPALALRALSRAACGWIREQAKELVTNERSD